MEEEIIEISEGQYLTDIMDFIPENAIIGKSLPGIGATYCEIISKRHSIIIEPNVPVIEGKRVKHPNILGVTEEIKVPYIVEYLKSDIEYKKIITTPESYPKIQRAFRQLKINYLDDYFFLFDECERIAKDIDYRASIDIPMEDFWNFKKRSFISATPSNNFALGLSEHKFKNILIQPDYTKYQHINIYLTHNVLASLKETLSTVLADKSKIEDNYFFFVNSGDMINCLIKDLDIKDISNIYCSRDLATNMKDLGYEKVYSSLNEFNKFNFFTSRFYSAVDIELDYKPHVTIVTDVKFVPHTMVDPRYEVIQIMGRFRNGIKSLTHITNTDDTLPLKTFDEVFADLGNQKSGFDQIKTLYNTAKNETEKAVFKEAMERVEFSKLLTHDHKLNLFKFENIWLDQYLKNAYNNPTNIMFAYFNAKIFILHKIDHTTLKFTDNKHFRRFGTSKKSQRKEIVSRFEGIDLTIDNETVRTMEQIKKEDPLIYAAIIELGSELITSLDYNEQAIWIELIKKAAKKGETNHPVMDAILNIFKVNSEYFDSEIKETIQKIYNEFEINTTASATDLKEFFNLSPRKTIRKFGESQKGCRVLSAKFRKRELGQNATLLYQEENCPKIPLEINGDVKLSNE